MQKVVYSVSKVNKDEKLKGVGYLVEGNLLIPSTSSKGNAYIRVFEDVAEKSLRHFGLHRNDISYLVQIH